MLTSPRRSPVRPLLVLFVLFVRLTCVEGRYARGEDEDEDERLLGRMLEAAERGMQFFASDVSSINVDGLFGMRVGQGQIIEALRECQSSRSCPFHLQRRLQTLNNDIDVSARAAMTYGQETDPEYFERFLATINQPYLLTYTPSTLTRLDSTPPGSDNSYDEDKGDACYARLLGTFVEEGKRVRKCNITRQCWKMMTEKDRSEYSITHQLLYFVLLEKEGCLQLAENMMASNVSETKARMCGSIYNEALKEVKDGEVLDMYQDLFLEQVLLCGCLGFENFLRTDWMHMVLTWQKASGCFSIQFPYFLAAEMELRKYEEEQRQLMKDLQWEVAMMQKRQHGRKLLREQVMNDGCLSHKSGLGFGTLCLYTRFLVRQIYLHP